MLCHCDSIIVLDSNNSITYIGRNIMFLNGTSGVSFEDTKKNISGRLEFNYNDVEIDITRRCLVEEQQYFSIPISCDVGFRNMMKKFFQNRTKMMELYVSSQPKLSRSYNMEYEDTNIFMSISAWPLKQLSHSARVGTSKTLKDKIMGIYDENRIKTVYCDQRKYDSSDSSDNEDEGVMSLVKNIKWWWWCEKAYVLEFGHDTRVDDMVCNDWFVYCKKSAGNGDLVVGKKV